MPDQKENRPDTQPLVPRAQIVSIVVLGIVLTLTLIAIVALVS